MANKKPKKPKKPKGLKLTGTGSKSDEKALRKICGTDTHRKPK